MFLIWIAKVIAALNANTRPGEIAWGIAYGFLLALVPADNLLWMGLMILSFFFKFNQGMCFVFLAIFKLFIGITDPLLDLTGQAILTQPGLEGLFTLWANTPLVPWTKFNDTVVMGGLIWGVVLLIPLYLLFRFLVMAWRNGAREKLANHPLVKGFLQWPLVQTIAGFLGKIANLVKEFI